MTHLKRDPVLFRSETPSSFTGIESLLESFATWLDSTAYTTLGADLRTLFWLQSHAIDGASKPTLWRLGSKLGLRYQRPGATSEITIPDVSGRLQQALIEWTQHTTDDPLPHAFDSGLGGALPPSCPPPDQL